MQRRAVVVGGAGALGRAVCAALRGAQWQVASVDLRASGEAAVSFAAPSDAKLREWARPGLDAVVCVAGGFEMGGLEAAEGDALARKMFDMNAASSLGAAQLAVRSLTENGLLVLTGAQTAFAGRTGFAVGYGMSKAAVHHLAGDVGAAFRGSGRRVVCMLPTTIDTPANRAAMPDADFSKWTRPEAIAQQVLAWAASTRGLSETDIFKQV